jgi:hypothetical protein|tara:strand:- start:159 stop:467 length:309 start_codon:yes stop_codon:yes gene_type:complete
MAFKLSNPPYNCDNTPIYHIDMEDGVMGKANDNGSIVINKDLDPSKIDGVIAHEKVHLDQMERGDLSYDKDNVIWKGKKYSRANMEEGAKNLPWEAEAYKKA